MKRNSERPALNARIFYALSYVFERKIEEPPSRGDLERVASLHPHELLRIPYFGRISFNRLRDYLKAEGFSVAHWDMEPKLNCPFCYTAVPQSQLFSNVPDPTDQTRHDGTDGTGDSSIDREPNASDGTWIARRGRFHFHHCGKAYVGSWIELPARPHSSLSTTAEFAFSIAADGHQPTFHELRAAFWDHQHGLQSGTKRPP